MLPASLSPHKVSRTGKVLDKLPRKKRKKKSGSKSPKVEGVAELGMSTLNSNQSKVEKFGDHFCEGSWWHEFDTMAWYRKNVLHPVPKTIVKKGEKGKKKHYDPSS